MNLLKTVKLASEIEPKLNELFAGKRIERVEWHDGHGDVIVFHMEDKSSITICTTFGLADGTVRQDEHKLYVNVRGPNEAREA